MKYDPGIGATPDLSLRVSVATLVRVIFKHPNNGEWMLALERKATLYETEHEHVIEVKSQPFGGAIRILDVDAIRKAGQLAVETLNLVEPYVRTGIITDEINTLVHEFTIRIG